MNRYNIWALVNLLLSLGLVVGFFLEKSVSSPPSSSVNTREIRKLAGRATGSEATSVPLREALRLAPEVWKAALAKTTANWSAALALNDPRVVASNDTLKTSTVIRYRYIFESLADNSPANRARIAQLLYEVELAERHAGATATELKVKDISEIERLEEENAQTALQQLVMNAGGDGPKIADIIRLRHTMDDVELFIRPTMEFGNVPLSGNQLIEVARALDRYNYRKLNSVDELHNASAAILNDCGQALSPEQIRSLAAFFYERETIARGPGEPRSGGK